MKPRQTEWEHPEALQVTQIVTTMFEWRIYQNRSCHRSVLWDVMKHTNIAEQHTASIFSAEEVGSEGGGRYLQNIGTAAYLSIKLHVVTSKKTVILIFTIVRASNVTQFNVPRTLMLYTISSLPCTFSTVHE
jgi:hypothetical protein